jgi:hypothetical protein
MGCGGKSYPLAPVSGRITLDGSPLAHAEVRFFPSNKDLPFSSGITNDNGDYKLHMVTENETRPGAIISDHRVTISLDQRKGKTMPTSRPHLPKNPGELLPAKYNHDSKLTFTVPPEGTSQANFDLKSK